MKKHKRMKLTILLVGENPVPMREGFAPYQQLFVSMFSATAKPFTFEIVDILGGEQIPAPNRLEAAIITGSSASVYDNTQWLEPLRRFIRLAHKTSLPMLGVCFGHQIIADALGGTVAKSENGWGLGRQLYQVQNINTFTKNLPAKLAVPASHQDQVIVPPEGCEVFLASEFTPNAGLVYANATTLSVQPHPEFTAAYAAGLCEVRRNNPLSDDQVDAAITSLNQPLDNALVAQMLADFLFEAKNFRK